MDQFPFAIPLAIEQAAELKTAVSVRERRNGGTSRVAVATLSERTRSFVEPYVLENRNTLLLGATKQGC
jgi:hypothetical protein